MPAGSSAKTSLFTGEGAEFSLIAGVVLLSVIAPEVSRIAHASAESSLIAKTAHHLVGQGINLASIHINSAAGERSSAVIVKGRSCIDIYCTAADDDISIGINTVSIPCSHCNGNDTA